MEHEGYSAKVDYDPEAELFRGEVVGIRDKVRFSGKTVKELKAAFRESVDDYLETCRKKGRDPERPCSGRFLVRVDEDLHRQSNILAGLAGKSLNAWVAECLAKEVAGQSESADRGPDSAPLKEFPRAGLRSSEAQAGRGKRPKKKKGLGITRCIGIDLGTTFSVVARLDEHGKPTTLPNAEGDLKTPSVVLYDDDGQVVVGRDAHRAICATPDRVADHPKRFMGRRRYPKIVDGRQLNPIELSAQIIRKLKADAEARMKEPVSGAVITVPAYFDEARRSATAEAGLLAGLDVIDVINEPTAAALAYAYEGYLAESDGDGDAESMARAVTRPRVVVVFDLGGGTFDVSVLRIDQKDLKVLATEGDVRLGGKDWDQRIIDHIAEQFIEQHGTDPRQDPLSYHALAGTAEEIKKDLSARQKSRYAVNHGGHVLTGTIDRKTFEQLTESLLYRTERRLKAAVENGGLAMEEIDQVLLVGGSSRMPQVGAMIRRVTGQEPSAVLAPDEAVAHGAAIHAVVRLIQDNGVPKRKADRIDDRAMNVVRAIQTSNVNAYSLGVIVTTPDNRLAVSHLIPRNTPLPASVTKRYGTTADNQKSVVIRAVEGESDLGEECLEIGTCVIEPLPEKLPKGSPVDVTFTYDNSGRLHVEAEEAGSGRSASVVISRRYMSEDPATV
ncbi:MAG: Hsp70 family protein [Phycisphaeraceae bacterium]|nr:Hsp70 family protein [Phycisphaeraceae bacterium]